MVSPSTRSRAASTAGVGAAWRSANDVDGSAAGDDADTTISTPAGSASVSARSNSAPSAANTRPGLHPFEHLAERAELVGLQRVGRRDRRVGHARVHRGQRQQAMLDAVAREDHHRAVARELPVEQSLRETPHLVQGVGVGDRAPAGHRVGRLARGRGRTLRQEHAIRGLDCPMLEPIGDADRVGRDRGGRSHVDAAIGCMAQVRRVVGDVDRPHPPGGRHSAVRGACSFVRRGPARRRGSGRRRGTSSPRARGARAAAPASSVPRARGGTRPHGRTPA